MVRRGRSWRGRLAAAGISIAIAVALSACPRGEDDPRANVPGLAQAIREGKVESWPVQLASRSRLEKACATGACDPWQRLELAIDRGAAWLAAFPAEALRFDAAVILAEIRRIADSPDLERAFATARTLAERDADHPQQRFWRPDFAAPAEVTSRWALPSSGARAPINNVLHEALYCREYGFRPEVLHYICGDMRDQGGYETTHAIWALEVARRAGCLSDESLRQCLASIQDELLAAQPGRFQPLKTLDIDLYGERTLHLVRTGSADPRLGGWVETLVGLQTPEGSWGVVTEGEPPYFRFHTTAIATWTLAEWARRAGSPP